MLGISSPHASGNIHKEVVPIDRHTGVSGQAIMAETEVYDESQNLVGFKTLLTFMEGKQGAETRKTKWKMQEFRINQPPKPVKKRSHDKVLMTGYCARYTPRNAGTLRKIWNQKEAQLHNLHHPTPNTSTHSSSSSCYQPVLTLHNLHHPTSNTSTHLSSRCHRPLLNLHNLHLLTLHV